MKNILEKMFKPAGEQQEQKEEQELNMIIFDDSKDQDYAQHLDWQFNENDDFPTASAPINKLEQIKEIAQKQEVDIIFVATPDAVNDNLFKEIVKLRNNQELKKQPIIFVMKSKKNKAEVEKIQKYSADIIELPSYVDLIKLPKQIKSVPELLGFVEDEYGDKMIKNKISFYKEYKDKLADRSEITADTEKELEILENIFKENDVKKVLDAGGGEGRIAIPLSEKNYDIANADSSHDLLEKMKTKTDKIEAIESDLRKLPVGGGQFDAITYNWHVFCDILGAKGKKQVLDEAYRSLKDDGVIVLDLPDMEKGEHKKDGIYIDYPGGEAVFVGYIPNEQEMKNYLEEAGFEDIQTKKWETDKGFPKITFTAKKIQNKNN